jgi:hypothetical protein
MKVRPPVLTGSNKELMTGIMYSDFFDAPRTVEKPVGKSKKAKVMEPKGKKGKKGKGVTFDEEDQEEEVEDAREVMGRFKEDLFADDDEEEVENDQRMSSFNLLSRLCESSAHIQQCRLLKRGRRPLRTRLLNMSRKLSDPRIGHYLEKLHQGHVLKTRYSRRTWTLSTSGKLLQSLPRKSSSHSRNSSRNVSWM